jgi:flagellar biosynthesis/type III secretory pathway chaperone
MEALWEEDLAGLLRKLSAVQGDLLEVLAEKHQALAEADLSRMAAVQEREQQMIVRLQECQQQRSEMLNRAAEDGRPAESIRALTASLPRAGRQQLDAQVQQATAQSRLLQHQSLTNWVLAQRSVLHLSQMLEIIATGGQLRPTYGRENSHNPGGSLVDQAA